MTPEYEIVCIRRDGGYLTRYFHKTGIEYIGYKSLTGKLNIIPIQQAIDMIEGSECNFYVTDGVNRVPVCVIEQRVGFLSPSTKKYLRTEADGVLTDNLENLLECQ
jgi:hypothetical protein